MLGMFYVQVTLPKLICPAVGAPQPALRCVCVCVSRWVQDTLVFFGAAVASMHGGDDGAGEEGLQGAHRSARLCAPRIVCTTYCVHHVLCAPRIPRYCTVHNCIGLCVVKLVCMPVLCRLDLFAVLCVYARARVCIMCVYTQMSTLMTSSMHCITRHVICMCVCVCVMCVYTQMSTLMTSSMHCITRHVICMFVCLFYFYTPA